MTDSLNPNSSQEVFIREAEIWKEILAVSMWQLLAFANKVIIPDKEWVFLTIDVIQRVVNNLLLNPPNWKVNYEIPELWFIVSLTVSQIKRLIKLYYAFSALKWKLEKNELEAFQAEFNKLWNELVKLNVDMLVALDWRDAAWKWWVIDRLNFRYNRKRFKNIAPWIPSNLELEMDYFERYLRMLWSIVESIKVKKWKISFVHNWKWRVITYDRSWYNYMYIWKVLWFCSDEQYDDYIWRVLEFEDSLTERAFRLHKFFLSISKETQFQRLSDRELSALKYHKVSPTDWIANEKYDEFTPIEEEVFSLASTDENPIVVVDFNDKHLGRLSLLHHILSQYSYDNKLDLSLEISSVDTSLLRYWHKQ